MFMNDRGESAPNELLFLSEVKQAIENGHAGSAIEIFNRGISNLVLPHCSITEVQFAHYFTKPLFELFGHEIRDSLKRYRELGKIDARSCSFCGNRRDAPAITIAGAEASICENCVGICNDVLATSRSDSDVAT